MKLIKYMCLTVIIMSALLVSCSKEPVKNLTNAPTDPLYNQFDIKDTSLQSGNLYYNGFLTTDGTWIYFQSDDGKSLVKSSFNGDSLKLISNHFPSFINVVEGIVFFIEGTNSGKIYKVDTDGKGETLVVDVNAKSLIATQLFLFYIDTNDGYVYRTLHDGSKKTLLFDHVTSSIQIVDDIIYFFTADESGGIYQISMEIVKTLSSTSTSISAVISSSISSISSKTAVSALSAISTVSTSSSALSSANSSIAAETALSTVSAAKPPSASVSQSGIGLKPGEYESINIQNGRYFYIDNKKNQNISVFENNKHKLFLELPVQLPFILSGNYLYYINQGDESRLYRVSSENPDDNEMIVNDRVNQFVLCGSSIYYRRENNLEIYRASIAGGISYKIT